jgi:hypothetical protein
MPAAQALPFRLEASLTLDIDVGNQRRPPRPPTQQEGLGIRHQGRPLPPTRPHLPQAKRRGGREGEAVFVRAGRECEGGQGAADGCCGGLVSELIDEGLLVVEAGGSYEWRRESGAALLIAVSAEIPRFDALVDT